MGTKTADKAATDDTAKTDDAAKDDAAKTAASADDAAKAAAATDDAAKTTPAKDETFTRAELDRQLAKQKKDLEKERDAAAARAKLSDDEKKDAEINDLKNSLRMRDARDETIAALEKAGAKTPALLFNSIKGDLEFDEKTGKVSNLKDLMKDLQADYPDQFGVEKPAEGIDAGAGQQGGGTKLTKEALAKMTPAEINALDWEEVKKVMAAK
jgi:hypothetical protein